MYCQQITEILNISNEILKNIFSIFAFNVYQIFDSRTTQNFGSINLKIDLFQNSLGEADRNKYLEGNCRMKNKTREEANIKNKYCLKVFPAILNQDIQNQS